MLQITEVGLVTSVGRDAVTAFSSMVAGISRPKEITYFSSVDPEFQLPEPLIGHPIESLTEGFHLFGLWTLLSVCCLEDLMARAGLGQPGDAAAWSRTSLVFVLPDIRSARFMSEGDESEDSVRQPYAHRIAKWLGVPLTEERIRVICEGRFGIYRALATCSELLDLDGVDRAIVLGVDSLLDSLTLEWLATEDRLKSSGEPIGLMPGEAAAALLVEKTGSRAAAKAAGVRISAIQALQGDGSTPTGEKRGANLAKVVARCLAGGVDRNGNGCTWVRDENGEQWRAEELGYCSLFMRHEYPGNENVMSPAVSVGDTGAASGVLGFCIGALAIREGVADSRQCLVSGSSYTGSTGAALISAA